MEILLEFGEYKRTLTIKEVDLSSQLLKMVSEQVGIVASLADVEVSLADDSGGDFFLQIWSNKWNSFVDLKDVRTVSGGDRLKAVQRSKFTCGSAEEAPNAIATLKKTPKKKHAQLLATMFPSSASSSNSRGKRSASLAFDPTQDSLAEYTKKKKKPFRSKPSSITIVVMESFQKNIPRGKRRDKLKDKGRVKNVLIQRNMSSKQVHRAIKSEFEELKLLSWTYLKCSSDGLLHISESQLLTGEDVISKFSKGSLYLCEKESPMCTETSDLMKRADEVLSKLKTPPITVSSDSESESDFETRLFQTSMESIEETRQLKQEQDKEFDKSLDADRKKSVRSSEIDDRRELIRRVRAVLTNKFAVEAVDGVQISMRVTGETSRHFVTFNPSDRVMVLYEYVFKEYVLDTPFAIFKQLPRQALRIDDESTIGSLVGVVLVVEECSDFPDPLTYLGHYELRKKDCPSCDPLVVFMEHFTMCLVTAYMCALSMYKDEKVIMEEFPFRIKFRGEQAVDSGGVSRDFCSAFWEAAYEHAFDGNTLLTPALHSGVDIESLVTIGTVVSHMYLAVGFLPVRVAFPSLACMLFGPNTTIPKELMVEAFVDSLCAHERDCLQSAVKVRTDGVFSSEEKQQLTMILGRYGGRSIPSPENLKHSILQAAKYEFVIKPCAALTSIHAGVPVKHKAFWEKLSVYELHSLYMALSATPMKVLSLLDEDCADNPNKMRVFKYLSQFIGNMSNDELHSFLRYVTGASVCPTKLKVDFNSLSGIARRPIGHTCANQLDLSVDYSTYLEFVVEFRAYLSTNEAWYMDAM